MRSLRTVLGETLRQCMPGSLRAVIPVSFKARARAALGIEPWPDLAIRHHLFRTPQYRRLREQAGMFDRYRKPHKPVIERGHQVSYLIADWFARAGIRTVFHAGYSNGRYVFYFLKMGMECGGTELRLEEAPTTEVPEAVFDPHTLRRMLRIDFFQLTPSHVQESWKTSRGLPIDVLFTEATFETLIPWRRKGFSVAMYAEMPPDIRRSLLYEKLPEKLWELGGCFRNMIFIEPDPAAAGAGEVFAACAERLPDFEYTVWRFRAPFDRLFRLSPTERTTQAVYAFTRDSRVLETLSVYVDRA
jgi:hypothetical protein